MPGVVSDADPVTDGDAPPAPLPDESEGGDGDPATLGVTDGLGLGVFVG